jgi:hypothetical protein
MSTDESIERENIHNNEEQKTSTRTEALIEKLNDINDAFSDSEGRHEAISEALDQDMFDSLEEPRTQRAEPPHPHLWIFSTEATLQALLWFNFIVNLALHGYSFVSKVSKGILRSVQSETYVFFHDSSYPYRLQDYQLQGPGIAPIEWYYDADKKLFISANEYETSEEYFPRHFPYLSGEVRYNDLTLHDITEFVNEVRWVSTGSHPSPKHLLAAWTLHSGIVLLNNKEHLTLRCIMDTGNEATIRIFA